MITQRQYVLIQICIVGDEHPTFAGGDGLASVEGKSPEPADGACMPSVINRADGFRRILNNGDAVLFPDGH